VVQYCPVLIIFYETLFRHIVFPSTSCEIVSVDAASFCCLVSIAVRYCTSVQYLTSTSPVHNITITSPAHCQYVTGASPVHHYYITIVNHQHVTSASPAHHKYCTSPVHHQCITSVRHKRITSELVSVPVQRQYIPNTSPLQQQDIASTSPVQHQHRTVHHQYIASMLPAHH
jgi:hypothetical protein